MILEGLLVFSGEGRELLLGSSRARLVRTIPLHRWLLAGVSSTLKLVEGVWTIATGAESHGKKNARMSI